MPVAAVEAVLSRPTAELVVQVVPAAAAKVATRRRQETERTDSVAVAVAARTKAHLMRKAPREPAEKVAMVL